MTKVSDMTLGEIKEALAMDGYSALVPRAAEVMHAARSGCLVWTTKRLVTTDASRIDERPFERG